MLQMPGSRNCGQIAVANLTGATLEEVTEIIGHEGGTKTVALVSCLMTLGHHVYSTKLTPIHQTEPWKLNDGSEIPENGLAKLSKGRGNWHWVAVKDGKILDGQTPTLNWKYPWKITSYLRVDLFIPSEEDHEF